MNEPIDNPWQLVRSEPGPDLVLFRTRFDWLKREGHPGQIKAVVLETADWVNVVALTPQNRLVVVHQYRFGMGKMTVEIPAGLMEPEETPLEAAMRELREETGYTTERWQYNGWVEANPAFMNNRCHFWLAQDVVQTHPLEWDDNEEIVIGEMTVEEVYQQIREGRMRNAFTILGLARVFDMRGERLME